MTGLYQSGSTCSNKQGQTYGSLYDAWGNVTSRNVNGTTATLSYDGLDHLTRYNAGSNSQEQYIYDAGGNRVLRRSTSSGTTMTVYAFGLEEHRYSGSGVHQSDTYYYSLGGMLVGESTGSGTNMFLTDALGSVIETISATANSAAVQGNQVYSPYGSSRYQQGSMGTTKRFTGQYNDSVSGLDYYNARYYDPVVGRFLSADTVDGNRSGLDPYAYVGGNPETLTDPTGLCGLPCLITFFIIWVSDLLFTTSAAGVAVAPPAHHVQYPANGPQPVPAPTPTNTKAPTATNALVVRSKTATEAGRVATKAIILSLQPHNNPPSTQTGGDNQPPPPSPATGGQGGTPPPVKPPSAGSPPPPPGPGDNSEPRRMPANVFQKGNAGSPRLRPQDIRIGVGLDANGLVVGGDVILDKNDFITNGGISTRTYRDSAGKWWSLSAGKPLPEGLRARFDDPNDPTHVIIEPTGSMNIDQFSNVLQQIEGWVQAFTTIPDREPC